MARPTDDKLLFQMRVEATGLKFGMRGHIADIPVRNFVTIGRGVSEFWYPPILPFSTGIAGRPCYSEILGAGEAKHYKRGRQIETSWALAHVW